MITLLKLRPYAGDAVAPSPNHGARRAQAIEGIVLHATQDGGNESRTLSWLCSPKSRVSCHLLVSRKGQVIRLVGDQRRAWHAGVASWRGRSDVNSITLGIEIANRNDGEPYTAAQYRRVAEIVAHYCRQGLTLDDVVAHSDVAPGRRSDPLGWDWSRFRSMVQHQLEPGDLLPLGTPVSATPPRRPANATPLGRSDRAPPLGRPVVPAPLGTPVAAAVSDAAVATRAAVAAARPAAPPAERARAAPASKPMLRSRTLWLNALTVLAAGSVMVAETLDFAFWIGLSLPEEITIWALFGVGVVNIVLRFATSQPVCGSISVQRSAPL